MSRCLGESRSANGPLLGNWGLPLGNSEAIFLEEYKLPLRRLQKFLRYQWMSVGHREAYDHYLLMELDPWLGHGRGWSGDRLNRLREPLIDLLKSATTHRASVLL
jgi:hypothetical protein